MTLNPKTGVFSDVLAIFGCNRGIATKWMKIDQDYLRTGTAIGSRASHEH